VTEPVNLIIRQGQSVYQVLPATGLETAGRKLVAHIRDATAAPNVICILSSDGPANRLLEFVDGGIAVTIGASIVQAWPVNARRVEWVYDIHSYDATDAEDSITTHAGTAIVYGTPTRPADVTPSELMPSGDARYTRFDAAQDLGPSGRAQAQLNILGEEYSPGGGGGAAAWGGITGTLSAQTDLQSALDLKAPTASPTLTGTPAAPTATSGTSTTQIATTAFVGSAVSTHAGATDPHGDRAFATSAVSTHSALTTGAHGITAAGAALLDDADAAAQRTTLGLGTAATQASGAFEASGAVSTHNAVTTAHGISAFGATLVDDASASAARTTLGLGTAATTAATDYATAAQGTDDRTASGLRTASTVVSISSATAPSSGQVLTATSTTAATWQTPSSGGGLYWADAKSTATPNATVPVISLTVSDGATNVDAAIGPKGTGSFALSIANNATSGGNKRGIYAVDLQLSRLAAADVASGQYSSIIGGNGNKASANYSACIGGAQNVSSAIYAISGGNANTASGTYSAALGGYNNTSSGNYSLASGNSCTASGLSSVALGQQSQAQGAQSIAIGNVAIASYAGAIAIGENSTASGWHSVSLGYSNASSGAFGVATGYGSSTRAIQGARSHCSNWGGSTGARQWMDLHVQCSTTDATPTAMTSNGAAASATNVLPLLNNSTITFEVRISWRTSAGDSGSAEICGTAKRGANAASTAIVGTNTIRTFGCDAGADPALTTVAVSVLADTTRGGIYPQFVGIAATTMKADAMITIVHVS